MASGFRVYWVYRGVYGVHGVFRGGLGIVRFGGEVYGLARLLKAAGRFIRVYRTCRICRATVHRRLQDSRVWKNRFLASEVQGLGFRV